MTTAHNKYYIFPEDWAKTETLGNDDTLNCYHAGSDVPFHYCIIHVYVIVICSVKPADGGWKHDISHHFQALEECLEFSEVHVTVYSPSLYGYIHTSMFSIQNCVLKLKRSPSR